MEKTTCDAPPSLCDGDERLEKRIATCKAIICHHRWYGILPFFSMVMVCPPTLDAFLTLRSMKNIRDTSTLVHPKLLYSNGRIRLYQETLF